MKIRLKLVAIAILALGTVGAACAQEKTLRLLTWADYAPKEVVAQFEKESGYKVELTLSNNEEVISKLRATGGAGFDLAQPSQDRITGPQQEFGIYKPMDLSKLKSELFIPSMLEATKRNTTLAGKVYGLPHIWGTDGLVVNTRLTKMADYPDLCRADVKGKTAVRLKRPTLLAFAFAAGKDPFALYNDAKAYGALMDEVGKTLSACKGNLKFFWDNKDQLLNGMRAGEVVGAMMWDTGGWKLNGEKAEIQFIAPKSGALGWIDTFAIPAKGRNDAAAYAWINFNMRAEIAARVAGSAGNFTASKGADQLMDAKLKAQFAASFPEAALQNVKWYPAVPAGIEAIEGKVLDRIKAAPEPPGPHLMHADLQAARIVKRFGDHLAVDALSFSVARGSFFSILGPSGCGKTTLLRMIAGFIAPDSGDIHIGGQSMAGVAPNRRPVNMVFQHLALFPMMSVGENVGYGLSRRGLPKAEIARRVGEMLERVSLAGAEAKRIDQLSGGQRQRVAIARSLVLEPTLLLLDEPLGALDLKLREHMKIELKQLQAAFGTTFVYITHDQSEALVLSDQVAVMNAGRFEQVGTPQQLYYQPQTPFVAGFVGASNCLGGRATAVQGDAVTLSNEQGLVLHARAVGAISAGDAVQAFVRPEAATLAREAGALPANQPVYAGQVQSLLFDGANSALLLQEERSRAEFRIALPQTGQFSDLQVGERVHFGFDPKQAVCFAAQPHAR